MITQTLFPKSVSEVRDALVAHSKSFKSVVMQCGHFLLYYDIVENRLLPGISSELTGSRHQRLRDELGHFPELTWKMGVDLLAAIDVPDRNVMIAVNDWQYVPDGIDRSPFYVENTVLPQYYQDALDQAGAQIKVLSPERRGGSGPESPYFSEQTLRNQYVRHIKDMIRKGMLPPDAELSEKEGLSVCNLTDILGEDREIYCSTKNANCATEVTEMIDQAYRLANCDLFINIFPSVCQQFVEVGSEIPYRLFNSPVSRIINIAMPARRVSSFDDLMDGAQYSVHDMVE
ncbi:MAG: hypothetical protein HYU59_04890 [Magnetospirillum gryphiswaldense]|nr:hypothetical protein [Magnetospirillum gryphiswaldense]